MFRTHYLLCSDKVAKLERSVETDLRLSLPTFLSYIQRRRAGIAYWIKKE